MSTDPLALGSLFADVFDDADNTPTTASLADAFGVPPVSILDRRSGRWQSRKRRWLALGLASGAGRSENLTYNGAGTDPVSQKLNAISGGTSIFDPVLTELAYRWHTNPGDGILDPFAGGSVRGIVAGILGRRYLGVDLRPEQVAENRAQALGMELHPGPSWLEGDSTALPRLLHLDYAADFVFSCPPYADLEVYSDDPRDLSTMPYADFERLHAAVIAHAVERLRRDRFAAWVISDVRDPKGAYRGLVVDTIRAFRDAGCSFWNDAVIIDSLGTAPMRAERPFRVTRKLTRSHQHLLIFVKGDAKKATARLDDATLGNLWGTS